MEILMPEEHIKIGEKLAAYVNVFKEKKYLNICKVYKTDQDELARGKVLTIDLETAKDLVAVFPKIVELVVASTSEDDTVVY